MLALGLGLGLVAAPKATALEAVVEVEEEVYRYQPADNGAGPMWCSGSTCLVRLGAEVYASGLETIPGVKPLNNCRWVLWHRGATGGWQRVYEDAEGRTREPSPIVGFPEGKVFVSANPTLVPPEKGGGGPARPEILAFDFADPTSMPRPQRLVPVWDGQPPFSEHSYRTFVADAGRKEFILFQNIDYTHAEWTFRDQEGRWSAKGRLKWPWGAEYAKPQPIRVCYPNVALRERAVHFAGVSDILDPNPAWRAYKKEITGKEWDYDFRRLFYTWTPDVTREGFREWVEIASRESTCGWISPCDLWLAPEGLVYVMWTERALDERLRAKFFPEAKQSQALRLATVKEGKVLARHTLLESREDQPGPVVSGARFHPLPDGRLVVIYYAAGPEGSGNRVMELGPGGRPGPVIPVPTSKPFSSFFTATPRAGSAGGWVVDLLGPPSGVANRIGYARVRLK